MPRVDPPLAMPDRDLAERLDLALSAGNVIGIWDWDVVTNRVRADARFRELYGILEDPDNQGLPIERYFAGIHPEDRARVEAEVAQSLATMSVFETEYRLVQPDGTVRWVAAQGRCIAGPDGACVRMPGVSYDITDRKLAELALRQSRDDRGFVLAQIAAQRQLADPEAILEEASKALGRRLGVNRVGFYRVIEQRIVHSGSWADGRLAPLVGVQETRHYGPLAEVERLGGRTLVFGDSRTEAGGQLTPYAQEGVLAGICVPLMTDGVWAAGIYLHQAAPRHWQSAEVELATEVVLQTWLAVERAEALLALNQRIARQSAELAEREATLREEFARREAAETQLRQLMKMEAVGQLTGGIAHDFNNMLAVVTSALNLLQRRLAAGRTDVQPLVEGAMDGARKAAGLTQRLLAFSRQQTLEPEVIDPALMLADLSDMLIRAVGESVTLTTETVPDGWKIRIDPSQLENVVLNLAVNARDAMPDGGALRISVSNVALGAASAEETGLPAGRHVLIRVADTGTGMAPEVLAKAFEPFFTTKPPGKGTGLGLSQVYGFIRQSGGHVEVSSEPGQGTRFDLYLPAFEGSAGGPRRRLQPDALRGARAGECVLVVEDDERLLNLARESLVELGYEVITAHSPVDALEILGGDTAVSLLLTDVAMPGMTGPALVRRARELREDLPVLFTSGYSGSAGDLPADAGFLPKPYSFEQLAHRVRQVLDQGETMPQG